MRWSWPAAVGGSVATGVLVVAGAGLAALEPAGATIALALVGGVAGAEWAALGLVVARRDRGNVVGALVVLVGLNVAFTGVREISWRVLAEHPDTLASLDWLVAALAESSVWLFVALALVLLCFPDGRVPSDRVAAGARRPDCARSRITPTARSIRRPSGRRSRTSHTRSAHRPRRSAA